MELLLYILLISTTNAAAPPPFTSTSTLPAPTTTSTSTPTPTGPPGARNKGTIGCGDSLTGTISQQAGSVAYEFTQAFSSEPSTIFSFSTCGTVPTEINTKIQVYANDGVSTDWETLLIPGICDQPESISEYCKPCKVSTTGETMTADFTKPNHGHTRWLIITAASGTGSYEIDLNCPTPEPTNGPTATTSPAPTSPAPTTTTPAPTTTITPTTTTPAPTTTLAPTTPTTTTPAPTTTTTTAPTTTTPAPTTTLAPTTTTTPAPSTTTTITFEPTTRNPTTSAPSTTTLAPSTTTPAPSTTTPSPTTTTPAPSTTTPAPSTTTSTTTTAVPTTDSPTTGNPTTLQPSTAIHTTTTAEPNTDMPTSSPTTKQPTTKTHTTQSPTYNDNEVGQSTEATETIPGGKGARASANGALSGDSLLLGSIIGGCVVSFCLGILITLFCVKKRNKQKERDALGNEIKITITGGDNNTENGNTSNGTMTETEMATTKSMEISEGDDDDNNDNELDGMYVPNFTNTAGRQKNNNGKELIRLKSNESFEGNNNTIEINDENEDSDDEMYKSVENQTAGQ